MAETPAGWIMPDWPAPPNVRAVVTTRGGTDPSSHSPYGFNVGTRCGDDPAAVVRNRASLHEVLSLPSQPSWLRQVHGTNVIAFDRPHPSPPPHAGEGGERVARAGGGSDVPPRAREGDARAAVSRVFLPPFTGTTAVHGQELRGARRADGGSEAKEHQADAAVTRAPGVVLAIQTADCLPVLFCVEDGSEIASAHAGWRGLSAGVLEATLDAMQTPRANILAWLGPAIAAQSYEVGGEVRDAFLAHDRAASAAFTATRPDHWRCDLYELARRRLHAAGVTRIFGGGFDTFTDPRLHSYRRDGKNSGRMASLVWMLPATI